MTVLPKPGRFMRLLAFLTFPFSPEGSPAWWWRMHVNLDHDYWTLDYHNRDPRCPYCERPSEPPETDHPGAKHKNLHSRGGMWAALADEHPDSGLTAVLDAEFAPSASEPPETENRAAEHDVERLARALVSDDNNDPEMWDLYGPAARTLARIHAERVAAEYQRLSQPADNEAAEWLCSGCGKLVPFEHKCPQA